jgi:hypothetical protein
MTPGAERIDADGVVRLSDFNEDPAVEGPAADLFREPLNKLEFVGSVVLSGDLRI